MPTEDIATLVTRELPAVGKETTKLRALPGRPIALPSRHIPLPVLRLPWLVEALKAEQGRKV
ncbi:MAG TPA: hypothetical protein VKR06_46445 [Ktedonosporobacter sp.]|nr:hypothetical protein [Ktedonosporobacter sp.]